MTPFGQDAIRPVLAVVPARGGSKGLPGKNVRLLAGLPLIAHSIRCAQACDVVDTVVVSTDSDEIAQVARGFGAVVPFLRPAELASDVAPMWPVIRHALAETERHTGQRYGSVLLLDPTTPGRSPSDLSAGVTRLAADASADGIVGVSESEHNPLWYCVVEDGGYMRDLIPEARQYARRQDVPPVYEINGAMYLWTRRHVLEADDWRVGRLLMHVLPRARAINIDDLAQFERAQAAFDSGAIQFPWVQ